MRQALFRSGHDHAMWGHYILCLLLMILRMESEEIDI